MTSEHRKPRDVATNQGKLGATRSFKKQGIGTPREPPKQHHSADTLILVPWYRFRTSGLQNSNVVTFFVLSHWLGDSLLHLKYGAYTQQIKENSLNKIYWTSQRRGWICRAWAMFKHYSERQNRQQHPKEKNYTLITLMNIGAKSSPKYKKQTKSSRM